VTELSDIEIKHFLETAALYSWREYGRPRINRGSLHIREIDANCEVCDRPRPFQDRRIRGSGSGSGGIRALDSGVSELSFTCASCGKAERLFLVEQVVTETTVRLQKFGELPRKPLARDRFLQRFLHDDLDNYEKALVCLTHEYGIAAFAYFRRVTENNIGRLLDLVREDAEASSVSHEILEALEELRKDTPMSKKIELANLALPPHLRPEGTNPLGRLYQVLSEGVHALSEQECLAKAKATSECLAFLIAELTTRREHRQHFKRVVSGL
jgi:hypothetical protein